MITKERLEELIEQGEPIYSTDTKLYGCVKWLELENQLEILEFNKNGEVKLFIIDNGWWHWFNLNDLYEDLEDVKWLKEFGCIERTERLELPTWEEFGVIGSFAFYDYKHNPISMMICLDPVNVAPCNDCIYIADKKNEYFCKPKTKENYTLACRKAKELFLGEKEEWIN